jgi:hypothetical protein
MTTRNPTFDNITMGGRGNNSIIRSLDISKNLYINSLGGLKLGSNGDITIENSGTYVSDGSIRDTSAQSFIATFVHEGNHNNRAGIKIQCGEDDPDSDTNATVYLAAYDGPGGDTLLGTLTNTGGGAFAVTSVSDKRLKKNVRNTNINGLKIINELKVRDYEWKKNNLTNTSFIAQELMEIYPLAVSGKQEDFNEKTQEGNPLSVSNSELIPILVKAVQELSQEIKQLKNKLEDKSQC